MKIEHGDSLRDRVAKLEQRNTRVEADKAWETCWMRKLFIAGITYLIVSLYLPILGVEKSSVSNGPDAECFKR